MEHGKHVFRIVILVAVLLAVVLLARGFLVPKTYGLYGRYRGANVAQQMDARPVLHGGAAACAECHSDQSGKRAHRDWFSFLFAPERIDPPGGPGPEAH